MTTPGVVDDGEDRTRIYCRGEGHALWRSPVASRPQDALIAATFTTSSPGSPYPEQPLDLPRACPLDGSGLLKAGVDSPAESAVRWA